MTAAEHATFRLPVGRGRYYTVRIFRSKAAMIQYQRDIYAGDGIRREDGFEAMCMSWRRYRLHAGRWHLVKECGAILFHQGFLGAGVVAHELAHAAFRLAGSRPGRRVDFRSIQREEAYCRRLGKLVSKFWRAYWRLEQKHPWLRKS